MQYSQEHLKTMVYAEFWGQTECIMGNWKIENAWRQNSEFLLYILDWHFYSQHYSNLSWKLQREVHKRQLMAQLRVIISASIEKTKQHFIVFL